MKTNKQTKSAKMCKKKCSGGRMWPWALADSLVSLDLLIVDGVFDPLYQILCKN